MIIKLDSPLKKAINTTKAHLEALELMGIKTVRDLLLYFPRTYEIHNESGTISDIRTDLVNTIEAKVLETTSHLSKSTRRWIYKAILEDRHGNNFEAVWFNKPYQLNSIREGEWRKFIGKIKFDFGKYSFQSPKIEYLSENLQSRQLVPVYPQTEKITSSWLLGKISSLLDMTKDFEEILPKSILDEEHLIKRSEAIKNIHLPDNEEILKKSRERLAFEELFSIQLDSLKRKKEFQENATEYDIVVPMDVDLVKQFFSSLPFTPTGAQKISIFEILKDMEKGIPMSRLLEGDVGSGKTLVAATVSLCAIKAGFQVAIMAPTEVLARQHFRSFSEMFDVFPSSSDVLPSPLAPLPEGEGKEKSFSPKYVIELARELRKKQTPTEEILWQILRDRQFYNLKFRRQHPIGRYVADFYCEECRLVIEIDGEIHKKKDQKEYDEIRDEIIKAHDINIFRIKNEEFEDIEKALEKIGSMLKPSSPISVQKALTPTPLPSGEGLNKSPLSLRERGLGGEGIKVGLLLGSQKRKEKQENLLGILNGDINIVVGTHALIQESVEFKKLGLAIVDEQHRFGVEQRKKLTSHGSPHFLSMTATPIPRTLALVAYGDQDLSVLNEMPPGRQEIITKVVNQQGRKEINYFIDDQIEKGRQVYVICPLIEESKSEVMAEVKSVTEEYERLKEIFPKREISYLHGKLKANEKDEIFTKFKKGETDILVSTSVIEVGVDVPNATIMLIEGAERFGLSQLHQFRGRVGRGKHQSYCFLFTAKKSNEDSQRLRAMEKYSDGFHLAEIDMKLRGPGEVYGVKQSGIPDLKMSQLTDQKFVYRVREATERFMRNC